MKALVIEFVTLPYFEVIPSVSISKFDFMVAWFVWGIRIYKENIDIEPD